ncbi:hypothetical protein N9B58_00825, partial [bacterium]|nr:hypothetical protein [bacterium]
MRKFIPLLLSFSLLTADEPAAKKADEAPKKKEFTVTDSVTIDGKKIDYRATASTLTLKTKDDKDRASVFSVAYERLGIKDKAT